MTTEQNGIIDITTPVVLCFPNLTEAKKFKGKNGKESGEPKFGASFMFTPDHPDFKRIKDRALALAKAKWPSRDIVAEYKAGTFKMPWNDGTKLADKRIAEKKKANPAWQDDGKGDFQRGNFIIKSASKFAPRLAYIEGGKISPDLEGAAVNLHKGKFYFGAKVLAQINLVPYDKAGETGVDGVTAYTNLVLTTNTGTRLSGGASAAETFKDYAGKLSDQDPTAGGVEDTSSDDF